MPTILPPEKGVRQYLRPGVVLPFVPRSPGAQHQRDLRAERVFFARLLREADAQNHAVIARLRVQFENVADAASVPDLSDDALRQLCRDLHGPDQRDDTARFELLDGPITVHEEAAMLRAAYATMGRLTQLTRAIEARRLLR